MTTDTTPEPLTDEVLDETAGGGPVARWNFQNAWPSKYSGPTLSAKGGGEVAMEEISISTEGLELDSGDTKR